MCVDLNVVLKRQKEKKVNFLVSVWEFLFYEVKAIPRGNVQKKRKEEKEEDFTQQCALPFTEQSKQALTRVEREVGGPVHSWATRHQSL